MNGLKRLHERFTGMNRRDEFRNPGVMDLVAHETGQMQPSGFGVTKEYELTLRVGVTYWANDAEKPDARGNAERALLHALHADTLAALAQIRHAVWDGDKKAALARISELESELKQ